MTVLFSVQHDDIEEKISSKNLPEYVFEFPLPFRERGAANEVRMETDVISLCYPE